MRKIYFATVILGSMLFTGCNPNDDLYNDLDAKIKADSIAAATDPILKTALSYTLVAKDYSLFGNAGVDKYDAFNDTTAAKTLIPAFLSTKYPRYKDGCVANITFNQFVSTDITKDAKFGYELTDADYGTLGNATVATNKSFDGTNKSTALIPAFLLTKYPTAVATDTQNVVIKYNYAWNLERYVFDGAAWSRLATNGVVTNFTQIGYLLTTADYLSMGGDVARYKNFSATVLAESYLPTFLKNKYPYALDGSIKVVQYKYYSGGAKDVTEQYILVSGVWTKMARYKIVAKTEQYIYASDAWMFDPAVRLSMVNADYQIIVTEDALKDSYGTAGYTYGASTYKNNFDLRLSVWKTYDAPRFDGMTDDQGNAFIVGQVKKGIILLLQKKYPAAVPIVPGIGVDAYYIVTFETYNNDFSRSYPSWKFQCTAAGSPATFEFKEVVQ